MSSLQLILALALVGQQPEEPKVAQRDLEKSLNEDVMGASVITVLSSGDLLIFDGAITVPAVRPSVEECGVFMSLPPNRRPAEMAELRKKADREAYARGVSTHERMNFVKKALEPRRECQALFKRKCDEIKKRVPLEARKAAVDDARKSIDRLLAEAKLKQDIKSYLANVIAECPLEQ